MMYHREKTHFESGSNLESAKRYFYGLRHGEAVDLTEWANVIRLLIEDNMRLQAEIDKLKDGE